MRDGIPRYVDRNGKIWKYDWEYTPERWEDPEWLESHIAALFAGQANKL